jgi:hypothetical protein
MIEKRRFIRIPLSVPIQFRRIGYIEEERNVSKDISIKGVRFLSQRFVPIGSYIKVEIELKANSDPVRFIAKVAWAKTIYEDELFEIGAEVWEISKEDTDFLREIVSF